VIGTATSIPQRHERAFESGTAWDLRVGARRRLDLSEEYTRRSTGCGWRAHGPSYADDGPPLDGPASISLTEDRLPLEPVVRRHEATGASRSYLSDEHRASAPVAGRLTGAARREL
jgi:hypothetical protein